MQIGVYFFNKLSHDVRYLQVSFSRKHLRTFIQFYFSKLKSEQI